MEESFDDTSIDVGIRYFASFRNFDVDGCPSRKTYLDSTRY